MGAAITFIVMKWQVGKCGVTAAALTYLGAFGFWIKSMSTHGVVGLVFYLLTHWCALGILAAKYPRLTEILNPLDCEADHASFGLF